MQVLDARSPWFPIAYSATLVKPGTGPRVEPIRYEVWLYWRAHVQFTPQTIEEMREIVRGCWA